MKIVTSGAFFALVLGSLQAAVSDADLARLKFGSMDEIRAASADVAPNRPTPQGAIAQDRSGAALAATLFTKPSPKPTKIIVGDPTSSLTKAQAMQLAQEFASKIPGAGVADLPLDYDGRLAPAIPGNAVFVVESVNYAALRPFDLIVYVDPAGKLRPAKLLAKRPETAVVGFEFLAPETQAEIAPKACVGRIINTTLYDPSSVEKIRSEQAFEAARAIQDRGGDQPSQAAPVTENSQ
jgi:hypothetical protein